MARKHFLPGTVVVADGKVGVVAYVRLASPDYSTPEAYSVRLDERAKVAGYTGTVFDAAKVRLYEK